MYVHVCMYAHTFVHTVCVHAVHIVFIRTYVCMSICVVTNILCIYACTHIKYKYVDFSGIIKG